MREPGLHLRELWYAILGRGLVGALAGMLLIATPHLTRGAMVGIFAGYLAIDGGLSLFSAARARDAHVARRPLLVGGVIDLVAAALALIVPGTLALRLVAGS